MKKTKFTEEQMIAGGSQLSDFMRFIAQECARVSSKG